MAVYDNERGESRKKLTPDEMKHQSVEELQREQRVFGCGDNMYTAREDDRNYCVSLANAIKEKEEAAGASFDRVETDPSSGITESHTQNRSRLILENHRNNRKVHPIAKSNWWYDA